ncbi:MAG: hypothetical protein K2X91_03130 [Thermoleophilia bacterium]|nr:hypothetical protein [Thermoleophilia bacterium]
MSLVEGKIVVPAAKTARTLQYTILAMAAGLALFIGIVAFTTPAPGPVMVPSAVPGDSAKVVVTPPAPSQGLTRAAAAFAAIGLVLSSLVPWMMGRSLRRRRAAGAYVTPEESGLPPGDEGCLASIYQTRALIGAALIEGAGVFATVAYLIERSPLALGLALGLLVVLMMRIPTAAVVAAWIDEQRETLVVERAESRLA